MICLLTIAAHSPTKRVFSLLVYGNAWDFLSGFIYGLVQKSITFIHNFVGLSLHGFLLKRKLQAMIRKCSPVSLPTVFTFVLHEASYHSADRGRRSPGVCRATSC